MKIIGHRGAAGLAPENTIAAIKAGIEAGADAIEFDVRQSSDGVFVLMHDPTLLRIAGNNTSVADLSLRELQTTDTLSGELIPSLEDALAACEGVTAVTEAKGNDWAESLAKALKGYQRDRKICVISFQHEELVRFKNLQPNIPCYVIERQNAFRAIRFARSEQLAGVDLSFWILNPFSYWYARLCKLEILTYTVDRPIYMRYFKTFYPQVAITTNFPGTLKKIVRGH